MDQSPSATRAKAQARRQFEKWALSYDRSYLNELVFFPCVRACQEEILRWQIPRGDQPFSVLDIGCGTGTLLSLLSRDRRAERLVGLDYSEAMVTRAGAKFAQLEGAERMLALQGDAEHLPLAGKSFDVVTCCNSFHHYPHQAEALRGIKRVLRPGGMLLLLDGFRDNIIGWLIFDVCVATAEKHVHHAKWSRSGPGSRQRVFASCGSGR